MRLIDTLPINRIPFTYNQECDAKQKVLEFSTFCDKLTAQKIALHVTKRSLSHLTGILRYRLFRNIFNLHRNMNEF